MNNDKDSNSNDTIGDEWRTVAKQKKPPKSNTTPSRLDQLEKNFNFNFIWEYNLSQINLIKNYVNDKVKVLVILRGCSGSGKSTLANVLKNEVGVVLSADSYFININNVYQFDKFKLQDAHSNCQTRARECMAKGVSPVIIDNTNIKIWEFKPYINLGVKYNYQIEIIEPNTPWKQNRNILFEKNVHDIPMQKIRQQINDFDKIENLNKFIEDCRESLNIKDASEQKIAKPKKSGILNLSGFLDNNDWSTNIDDVSESKNSKSKFYLNEVDSSKSNLTDKSSSKPNSQKIPNSFSLDSSLTNSFSLLSNSKNVNSNSDNISKVNFLPNEYNDTFEDEEMDYCEKIKSQNNSSETDESKNILKSMFPSVDESIIVDLLLKYENDLNMVSNLLADSVDFSVDTNQETDTKKVYQPNSLKYFCIEAMEKLELQMQSSNKIENNLQHIQTDPIPSKRIVKSKSTNDYSQINSNYNDNNNSYSLLNYPDNQSDSFSPDSEFISSSKQDSQDSSRLSEDSDNEEPIMYIKIDKLRNIIELFATPDELEYLNENCDIPIGLNLAQKIYSSWKNEVKNNNKVPNNLDNYSQIENDKKLSQELFDEINMRNPINKQPLYLSDKGINSAEISLRQIMAEEIAQQNKKDRSTRINENQIQPKMPFYSDRINGLNGRITNNYKNQSDHFANKVKLKNLHETYENLVDKKAIEEIFKNNNYNFHETTKYINTFYGYNTNDLKQPNKVYDIKNTKLDKRKSNNNLNESDTNVNSKSFGYFSNDDSYYLNDNNENLNVDYGRDMAKKYSNIRQDYFEKAAEAHRRGWGAVAQYYAEMGHEQTKNIDNSNKLASLQIFNSHNPDMKNSITLDLHGLHVKEAIAALKDILTQKRNEPNGAKRRKPYIFVITGCGHHSENGPRLLPNVVCFLNQKGIKYRELQRGLLQVFF